MTATSLPYEDLTAAHDPEKMEKQLSEGNTSAKNDFDHVSEELQEGVKKAEAVTLVWSRKMLWVVFGLLYLVSFVDSLLQSVQGNLTPYVTSAFQQHGLLATTGIISTILGGAIKPTLAKFLDIRSRTEGFVFMVLLIVLGMIMKATCQNVETYVAAQTFYWVGHIGLLYIITIILADMTSLRNRMIIITLNGTPLIASTFAGPRIAELFYNDLNFRWAFGAFTIILVVFCIPVVGIFWRSEMQAKKRDLLPERDHTRSAWESVKHYFVEFDVVGLILLTAGWTLTLLPFSLVSYALHGWKSATVICMLVFGVVSLAAFVIWEKYFATVQLFPYKLLKDRTVIGGCLTYGLMFLSIFCWDIYYGSYLQVVNFQSITNSGYIVNSFGLSAAIVSPLIAVLIRYTGQFKWPAMIGGIPFTILGTALLIHFRTPNSGVGFHVMCQIFNGIGTGFLSTCGQLAIMAAVTHQDVAMVLALFDLFGSIGAAIGMAIAGGIWTNTLRSSIEDNLPEGSKDLADAIYADLTVQLGYPRGDPIREAINSAYGDVQRYMVITGAAFIPLVLVAVLIWRNINVKNLKQTKGNVF